jgi:glutaredoxin
MIEIWSKPQCVFCDKAVQLCQMKELDFKKYMIDVDYSREDLMEKFPNARTFPQITMDNVYIGGYTELEAHLNK